MLDRLSGPAASTRTPRGRTPADPALVNDTTVPVFWAPPFGGRWTLLSWLGPDQVSPASPSRALGVCFTAAGRVVLVTSRDGTHWNHPGGGRQSGESLEETLVREEPFVARHQTVARTVVAPEEVPELMVGWQPDSLRRLLETAASASPAIELTTAMDGFVLRELTPEHIEAYWAPSDSPGHSCPPRWCGPA